MHLRGIANAIATASNWCFNCILLSIFLQITKTETGKIISYTILAAACFATYIFVYRYLPETKDVAMDECVRLVLEARLKGV